MLAAINDRNLAAYVVWVPELGATPSNVPEAMTLVSDPRAHQYWDGTEQLGHAYEQILPTPGPAWDVYLLFPAGERWEKSRPPDPAFWMHQLAGITAAPRLDPDILRDRTAALLRSK